jgi:hypothetical protein
MKQRIMEDITLAHSRKRDKEIQVGDIILAHSLNHFSKEGKEWWLAKVTEVITIGAESEIRNVWTGWVKKEEILKKKIKEYSNPDDDLEGIFRNHLHKKFAKHHINTWFINKENMKEEIEMIIAGELL